MLETARSCGLRVALCTGRLGTGATADLAARIDPDGLHVFQGGAVVTALGLPPARARRLPAETLCRLVQLSDALGLDLEVYDEHGYAVQRHTDRTRLHARHLGVEPDIVDFATLRRTPDGPGPTGAVWLVPQESWELARELAGSLPSVRITGATAPWAPGLVFGNICRVGVSKGAGIRWVAEHLGIALSQVAMVGDGENDLDALEAAGIGVAMGSATPVVRAAAHHVVSDADRGGFAEALALLCPPRPVVGSAPSAVGPRPEARPSDGS